MLARRHGERGSKRALYAVSDNYEGMLTEQNRPLEALADLLKNGAGTVASGATRDRLEKWRSSAWRYARRWRQRSGSGARRSRNPNRRDRLEFPRVGQSQSGNNFAEGEQHGKDRNSPRSRLRCRAARRLPMRFGLPLLLLALIFLPAGTIAWRPGWIFLTVLILGFGASALVLARVKPIIYRARSRI